MNKGADITDSTEKRGPGRRTGERQNNSLFNTAAAGKLLDPRWRRTVGPYAEDGLLIDVGGQKVLRVPKRTARTEDRMVGIEGIDRESRWPVLCTDVRVPCLRS